MKKPLTIDGKARRLWVLTLEDGSLAINSEGLLRIFDESRRAIAYATALPFRVIEVQIVPVESEE